MESNGDRIRLGIVGCGRITEQCHLPAALATPGVEVAVLCDPDPRRLQSLRRRYGLTARTVRDHREVMPHVDAVIVATPNHLHEPIAVDFLTGSIHVLCEKPLAVNSLGCERVTRVAAEHAAVLAVGHFTRFFPSTELTKDLIDSGDLGPLISFDFEFGAAKGWATLSGFNLSRELCGGGVLLDYGVHFLDRMRSWFPDVRPVRYRHDSRGGVEANCIVDLECVVRNRPVTGRITLSRTHQLANRLRVVGEEGTLVVREGQEDSVTFTSARRGFQHEISFAANQGRPSGAPDPFRLQLEDFVDAIRNRRAPRITGETAAASLRLIEDCYQMSLPLEEPWVDGTIARLPQPGLERSY
jgi:predicted dehydrogenase